MLILGVDDIPISYHRLIKQHRGNGHHLRLSSSVFNGWTVQSLVAPTTYNFPHYQHDSTGRSGFASLVWKNASNDPTNDASNIKDGRQYRSLLCINLQYGMMSTCDIDTQPCPWREYSWEASREMCRRPAWQRTGWKIGETGVKSCCCFIFTWLKIRQLQGWRELLRSWLLPPLPLLSP